MAGLGFIHLGFLAAAAAVAVPILIHLLFRPRARKVKIGTLFFLRSVLRDSARRRKVRRWILLALRAAGVLLLALLFARPYRTDAAAQGSEREVILLIDRSASMGASGCRCFAVRESRASRPASCSKTCPRAPPRTWLISTRKAQSRSPRPGSTRGSSRCRPARITARPSAWARDIVDRIAPPEPRGLSLDRSPALRHAFAGSSRLFRAGARVRSPTSAGRSRAISPSISSRPSRPTSARASPSASRPASSTPVSSRPGDVPVRLVLDGKSPIEQTVTVEGRSRATCPLRRPDRRAGPAFRVRRDQGRR